MPGTFKYSYKETLRENTGLAVFNSGFQKCEGDYSWGPAMRDHYLIHYVAGGRGLYHCKNQEFALSAGDLFLVFPETIVRYTASLSEPWEYYWVGFHGADARRLTGLAGFSPKRLVLHEGEHAPDIPGLLIDIYDARGASPANDAAMTGRLYLFLSRLIADSAQSKPHNTPSSEYFEQAVKFIAANLGQELNVTDIAAHIALSRSQLYRVFMLESGMPPVVFLNTYKVNEACGLLRRHELTVSQAAVSVGFADPLYFSRIFRKIKGMSPSEYKNRHASKG